MLNALITGASRGIGRSAALHVARRGYRVIVTWKSDLQAANEVVRSIEADGGVAAALQLDVGAVGSFPGFVASVKKQLSAWDDDGLDALVNNAGFGQFTPLDAVTEGDFDALFGVHLKGPFFLTQALLPVVRDGSHIVNVSSATVRVATPGVAPYAAFKGGLEVLTRYQASELSKRRIRANSVAPGAIRTELGGGLTPDFEKLLASQIAMGRVGEPDDVGRFIGALLGPDLAYVNAQCLEVAGGYFI